MCAQVRALSSLLHQFAQGQSPGLSEALFTPPLTSLSLGMMKMKMMMMEEEEGKIKGAQAPLCGVGSSQLSHSVLSWAPWLGCTSSWSLLGTDGSPGLAVVFALAGQPQDPISSC